MRLSTFIYWLVAISILSRLVLSSWLLDSWYPYSAEGGQPYYKIHPGSIIAFVGVAILGLVKGVPTLLCDLWRMHRPAVVFIASVVLVSSASTILHGMSGTAYLVDTFLAAGCYSILLAYVDAGRGQRIATLVLVVAGANSFIAIAEYVSGFHLLPQPHSFGFFRASALFGHPLNNGLLTAVCMFAALVMPWRAGVKIFYISLLLLSLFAFGARGALLVSIIALVLAIVAYPHITGTGRRNRIVMLPLAVAGVALITIAVSGVLFGTEFGYTIASRMAADESTGARWASMAIVNQFTAPELLWGMDAMNLAYLMELAGVPIVENFWVAMMLRLGVPLLLVLAFATAWLLARYVRRSSFYLKLTLVVFVAVASTNNSLATKSCALAVLVVLLASIDHCRLRRGQAAR